MSTRSWKLVATNESAVIAKPGLDAIVMKNGESDRGFSDAPRPDGSDGFEVFSESNNLLDEVIAPKTSPERRGR